MRSERLNYYKKIFIYSLILVFLVFIAYVNSLNNAFVSDDISGIVNNAKNIGDFKNVLHPISFIQPLLYFISYKIAGLNPFFFRIYNIFFHLGTVLSLFSVLNLMVNADFAFLSAALFAVHPILTEAVTWISGVNYVIGGSFFLLALLTYISSKKVFRWYWISLVLYYLSVATGMSATALSAMFFLYELLFGDIRKNWLRTIPYFVISIVVFFFDFQGFGARMVTITTYEKKVFLNPLQQIPIAITSYLQLIFWPDKLSLYHSDLFFSRTEYLIRLVITLGLFGVLGILWKKNKLLFFWLSFFIIGLLPTLTPFGISWIVAERYVYLGTIGIVFVFSYFLFKLIRNKKTEAIGHLIFVIIVLVLIIRTIVRNIDWKNEDNLWIATGKTAPYYYVTHNNLGDFYGRHGDLQRSAEEFQIAIKLNSNYADAYHNLGNTYWKMGKIDSALKSYEKAFELNPNLWQSQANIATIYFEQAKYSEALDYMNTAIKVNPNNTYLYTNLGVIYVKIGNKKLAEEAFLNALRIDPNNQQAKIDLSSL